MRGIGTLSVAVALLSSTVAFGACVPNKARPSCVDLSTLPGIAQQVIATDKPAVRTEIAPPPALPKSSYDGPTVGVSNAARRAPEIGYHWSID